MPASDATEDYSPLRDKGGCIGQKTGVGRQSPRCRLYVQLAQAFKAGKTNAG